MAPCFSVAQLKSGLVIHSTEYIEQKIEESIAAKDWSHAIALLQANKDQIPDAEHRKVWIYLLAGKRKEALKQLDENIKKKVKRSQTIKRSIIVDQFFSDNAATVFKQGMDLFKANKFEGALSSFLQANQLDRDNSLVMLMLARTSLKLEDFARAQAWLEQSLSVYPTRKEALVLQKQIQGLLKKMAESLKAKDSDSDSMKN